MDSKYKEFLQQQGMYQQILDALRAPGSVFGYHIRDASIEDGHIKDMVLELPYETQEVVSPKRNITIPFYLPETLMTLRDVKVNLYFPGLQDGDYPMNSPNLYIQPAAWMMLVKKNGAFSASGNLIDFEVGTGANGADYWWYRCFLRYHIASLFGFKIDVAELRWSLLNKAFRNPANPNAQHSIDLDSVPDFGTPDDSMWGTAADVDHGVIQVYTDNDYKSYSKDITARISDLIGSEKGYSCFRLRADTEPADSANANNYRYQTPWNLYVEMSEDETAGVSLYCDNGNGFGDAIGSFDDDREEIDLSGQFHDPGKKQIKLTCDKTRRVDVLVRIGLTLSREGAS